MILIADSGSTRTTWSLVDKNTETQTCVTSGINPFFLDAEDMLRLLKTEFTIPAIGVSSVFFYGAGCATEEKKRVFFDVLPLRFGTRNIEVHSDLLAAARSLCGNDPGVACILGTGSNSCLYDGKDIARNVSPLGFILGDEGSGAYLGKKLIADIFKNQLSESVRESFLAVYPEPVGEILENVYKKPFPNRFLAQYALFIAEHMYYPEIAEMVDNGFREFFERNVIRYPDVLRLPVHFTGSIAFFFADRLKGVARSFGLTVGNISRNPMEGLISYHLGR